MKKCARAKSHQTHGRANSLRHGGILVPLLILSCSTPSAGETNGIISLGETSAGEMTADISHPTSTATGSSTDDSTITGESTDPGTTASGTPNEDGDDPLCGDGIPNPGVYCFVPGGVPDLIRPEQIADFNGDTHLDILEQVGSEFKIVFGDGNGSFPESMTFVVPDPWAQDIGETALAGDFDNEPGIDIATLGSVNDTMGVVLVFSNDGSGTQFGPPTQSIVEVNFQNTVQGAILDINLDGAMDLIGVSSALQQPILQPLINDGLGAFTVGSPGLSHQAFGACLVMGLVPIPAVGDAGPGLASYGASCNDDRPTAFPTQIVRRDGQGTVTFAAGPSTGAIPMGLAAGDINGDDADDLVVWNQGEASFSLFSGVNDGSFAPESTVLEAEACPGCPCPGCESTPELVRLFAPELDGDGLADILLTANHTWAGMTITGSPKWVWLASKPLLVGDFNEDGLSDFVSRTKQETIEIILSNP